MKLEKWKQVKSSVFPCLWEYGMVEGRREGVMWESRLIDYKYGGLLEEVAFIPLDVLLVMVNTMPIRCL